MKDKIIEVLKQCYDPELPIDLWSLGLIYEITSNELKNNLQDQLREIELVASKGEADRIGPVNLSVSEQAWLLSRTKEQKR